MGCVYKLTSPSGKSYIGMSKFGLEKRWAKHVEHAMGKRSSGYLYAALRKHGPNSFTREILAECEDYEDLRRLEIESIASHNTFWPSGYNLTKGGEGTVGWKPTQQASANISAAQKKRFQNPEERGKLAEFGVLGQEASKEKWAPIREAKLAAAKAWKESPEFKAYCSKEIKKALARPEVRKKVLASAAERAASPTWREKISASKKGVSTGPCTDRRRQLVSDARKREWADPVIREKRLAGLAKARAAKGAVP